VKKWKDLFDIDGLRLDVAYCLDEEFLSDLKNFCAQFTDSISKEQNSFFILGETIYANDMTRICPSKVNSCTNYEIYKGMYSSLNSKNLFEISYSLNRQFGNGGICKNQHLLSFVDNHDVERIASLLSNKNLLSIIYAMLFTIPGLPCVYYGSEWAVEGKKSQGDKVLRPCFENPQWNDLTSLISKLSNIRKNNSVLNYGEYENIFIMNEQLIFKRVLHSDNYKKEILVAINISENNYYLKPNNCGYGAFSGIYGNWKNLLTGQTFQV
jgi:glycosidase